MKFIQNQEKGNKNIKIHTRKKIKIMRQGLSSLGIS